MNAPLKEKNGLCTSLNQKTMVNHEISNTCTSFLLSSTLIPQTGQSMCEVPPYRELEVLFSPVFISQKIGWEFMRRDNYCKTPV